MQWGAEEKEWSHFDLVVGITEDLLPVVCNPAAVVSKHSALKDFSKTPSQYNKDGHVVGFAKWTSYLASSADVTRWSKIPDLGICIQTRHVRAVDIDVADTAMSGEIVEFFLTALGFERLPLRYRSNSGKCLLAFIIEGNFGKQVFDVQGGRIEFLATGQQFVAIGTHKTGVRYEWQDGLPEEFPVIGADEFTKAWDALSEKYAISKVSKSTEGKRRDVALRIEDDSVSQYLEDLGHAKGRGKERQVFIDCPWKDKHSMDGGAAETAYFLAHTRGYQQGHFKCFHASCAEKTDGDFLEALGWHTELAKDFEELPAEQEFREGGLLKAMPNFKRDRAGRIQAVVDNVFQALMRPDVCKFHIRLDTFRDEIMVAKFETNQWRPFRDVDYMELKLFLEQNGFCPLATELVRGVVLMVAERNQFDTAKAWLDTLVWDGTPRCQRFLSTYFSVEENAYHEAVSLYLWTALSGRVITPGAKADMVPILVGAQGVGKSTGVAAISPNSDFFTEITLGDKDDDLARRMRGRLVGEISELRGLHTRDLESIKAFITRTHEQWVPKYKEFSTTFPRRIVFIGTTNKNDIMSDETGNRRWLPVTVGKVDVAGIAADRDQLWAEARSLYESHGIMWQGVNELAESKREDYQMDDAWEIPIVTWLNTADLDGKAPKDLVALLTHDILRGALSFETKNIKKGDEMRCGKIMRRLGYEIKRAMVEGRQVRAWSLCEPITPNTQQFDTP